MRRGGRAPWILLLALALPGVAAFNLIMAYAFNEIVRLIAITAAALSCASAALLGGRLAEPLRPSLRGILGGLGAAAALYIVFYAGNLAARAIGRGGEVEAVYGVVEPDADTLAVLALASIFEEVYWRGAIQEVLLKGVGLPWWLSSLIYALGHAASGMPVFVAAAFTAGLALGYTAHRLGVTASAVAHYTWLLLMFYVAPVAGSPS